MAIDSSIYSQFQAPDILGAVKQGMSMREMANAGKRDQARFAADQERDKQQALMAQQKAQQEKQAKDLDLISRVAGSIKDQGSYEQGLGFLKNQGVDVSKLSPTFNPQEVQMYGQAALSTLEQMNQANKDRDYNQSQDKFKFERTTKQKELELREREIENRQRRLDGSAPGVQLAGAPTETGASQTFADPSLEVPGVGVALTKTDANTMKDASAMKQKFDRQISELIGLRKEFGNEMWNKDAVGRGEQLSKDLLLTYKNLAKLGVLSQADQAIINEIIPSSPLSMEGLGITDTFNMIKGQDPKLTKLLGFQKDMNEDYANNVATRIRGGGALANNMRGEFRNQAPTVGGNGFINEAQASGATYDNVLKAAPQMQGQDLEAFKWASQNSQDPRAQGILQNLNNKYGGR